MTLQKQHTYKSPDLEKLQEVVINSSTSIYIKMDEDPVIAKKRYLLRNYEKTTPGVRIK